MTSGREETKKTANDADGEVVDEGNADALYQVLHDTMMKDTDTNILLGNVQMGEAEEIAAGLAFAAHTRSPVLMAYYRHLALAKRAERGGFRKELFSALKTIGRREESKPGIFQRMTGGGK